MSTYYIDPVNGLDTNAGDSFAAGHPWKTIKKAFAAGNEILLAKSPETLIGTGAIGAYPDVTIATDADYTGSLAQYDVIRLTSGGVLDDTIYMIQAVSATVITLYRPYRGTVESGKSIYKLTKFSIASDDLTPSSGNGTAASPILLKGGINTATLAQDGFTIVDGNNAAYGWGSATRSYWTLSRLAIYYFQNNYAYSTTPYTGLIYNNCYSFRQSGTNTYGVWNGCKTNGFVAEQAAFRINSTKNCEINDLETADPNNIGFQLDDSYYHVNTVVNRWKNAGYASKTALNLAQGIGGSANLRFNDPIFDELASGCSQIGRGGATYDQCVFINPTIGAGSLIVNWAWIGKINFQCVNGDPTDNRTYFARAETGKYTLLSSDSTVYHTAAPAAKVSLYQSAYPHIEQFYIPCEADAEKTVSVWLRKNSSYGSSTLPTMRLIWMTGDLVTNVYEASMSDTNDTWEQLSHAVTPSVKGAIIVELIFQSSAAGAIAWYDDIEVA